MGGKANIFRARVVENRNYVTFINRLIDRRSTIDPHFDEMGQNVDVLPKDTRYLDIRIAEDVWH